MRLTWNGHTVFGRTSSVSSTHLVALAEKLANDGTDGTATIVQMVATGRTINMQPELQSKSTRATTRS